MPPSLFDFDAIAIDGTSVALDRYRGGVLLVVNVASQCGFTPQYRGLEDLYRRHKDAGLVVLGFPCDQFGHQEPGTNEDIRRFCTEAYDVTFPMFAKIDVNGRNAHPLFVFLKSQRKGVLGTEAIKWNFTKFLVDRDGRVVRRFAPSDTPEKIEAAVRELLGCKPHASSPTPSTSAKATVDK
ncbi:MAG TPA: glutathione peroxidase [Vicinamibacterales bacterium]|jgi:glutathione peroxidase|nr:glutathione peroxidase [Vicinamibacterales bacterium]